MSLGSKKLRLLITLSVFALFIGYFLLNIDKFKPLLHLNIALLGLIALADLATIISNGLFIKFVLQPFRKFISISESAYVSLISSVGNFFAPVGAGFGIRAVYLKKKHGLPYGEYISTLSGNYIIVFLVNSFFALLALFLLRANPSPQYDVLVILFSAIFVVSMAMMFIKLPQSFIHKVSTGRGKSVYKPINQVMNGWNKIVSNKRLLVNLIWLIIVNFLLSMIIAKTEITALHFSIGFPQLILFSVLGSLSLFVNITPANLGVKEAIYIFSATVIGFSTSQILLIALIDRGVLFIVLMSLWLIFVRRRDIGLLDSGDQLAS